MIHGVRFGALVLVAVLWCRGTFGGAATVGVQIFNVHVDEYATKAVITWETDVRTDTAVEYGKDASYGETRANPEQRAETIHAVTLEGLAANTPYHYRVVVRAAAGAEPFRSTDFTFHTAPTDALGERESEGLVSLTKSYVDKLSRMTPDQRSRLSASLQVVRSAPRPEKVQHVSKDGKGDRDQQPTGDAYDAIHDNPFVAPEKQPLSTFSIDVDTASLALVRRYLMEGHRPPKDAVRIEELVNSFRYEYPQPDPGETLTVHSEIADCPWAAGHRLLKLGLKGKEVREEERPATNLVFLIDVSGSMMTPDRLPLVKQSLKLLLPSLRAKDRVSLVVYAGNAGLVLPPTPGDQRSTVEDALERLEAGGSTNGGEGIALAYATARRSFIAGGINRVLLATDGDFNVGTTGRDDLVTYVAKQAKDGIALTVLGFGMGNFKDRMVEQLADKGNGNYAYIDGLTEARKVLVEQAGGTLHMIAKDVKLQLEFNPRTIAGYRLIGYENRVLADRDFDDDTKDAGDLGAGHTVTALYELVPRAGEGGDLATVKLRYKQPAEDRSRLLSFRVGDSHAEFAKATPDLRFAAAVAGFGMLLRESPHRGTASFDLVAATVESTLGADPGGHRKAFLDLVNRARRIR